MKQFDRAAARQYWIEHAAIRSAPQLDIDPDALDNVCHPGLPPWLNRYYAMGQRRVYDQLLKRVPSPKQGAQALDVGCGAGRWCRRLEAAGYRVTGVDLQRTLITALRQRHPTMTFACEPFESFTTSTRFALLSSVTVLQHNPPEAQTAMLRQMRRLVADDGHAIVLENIRHQGRHMFAHSGRGWRRRFMQAGFEVTAQQSYDHSPWLRLEAKLARGVGALGYAARRLGLAMPLEVQEAARAAHAWAQQWACRGNQAMEPVWCRFPTPYAVHCGFVLQAR